MHVDRAAKEEAEKVLSAYNMTLSEAFGLFLRQIVVEEGIPFDAGLQDMVSLEAMESFLCGSAESGESDSTDGSAAGWDSPLYMPLSQGSESANDAESADGRPEVM